MEYLALLFLLLALFLFYQARVKRRAVGLPGGRVIYTDMRGWGRWKSHSTTPPWA